VSPTDAASAPSAAGGGYALFRRVEVGLGMLFFALTSVLVFVGALGRAIGMPLIWSIDMAQAAFIWACVIGADVALERGAHIEIDLFVRKLPAWLRRALAVLWWLSIAAFLAALFWYGVQLTRLNVERPMGDTDVSYAWVTAAIPAGALLMLFTALRKLWRGLSGAAPFSLEGRDGRVL
jgi:TRAP-type C4-dicarboxylate transport system permease small subunit